MHESNVLAKPHPYIFFTQQLDSAWKLLGSYLYLQGTHTYMTDAMHMLLYHTLLVHVGGGKWPGDEAKTGHSLFAYSRFAYSRFAYSRFAYFRPKSAVSPTLDQKVAFRLLIKNSSM